MGLFWLTGLEERKAQNHGYQSMTMAIQLSSQAFAPTTYPYGSISTGVTFLDFTGQHAILERLSMGAKWRA